MNYKSRLFILIFLCALGPQHPLFAEGQGGMHLSYIREVSNPLALSDFQIGSEETIRDVDGHGSALGFLLNNQGHSFWTLEIGSSRTHYEGTIEDGVNIDFSPQTGTGFEALSESKNIFYDVALDFENPYMSLTYTNWKIVEYSLRGHYLLPSTYGIGLIKQKASGLVTIRGIDDSEIATATYKSGDRRFFGMGWEVNFEFLYLSLLFRNVEAPELEILSCNEAAVGELACARIRSATGNRNNQTAIFNGGVFKAGFMF